MSEKTVLVIDDSATIRKLADTNLSGAGYHVVLAPTAEDGLRLAAEHQPDLILLDHQLPGTTGYEVCCRLLKEQTLSRIPVVISSTLRKKAYAEYVELDNVVDMLPKPYTGELLLTTVANAIETANVVVASQYQGTAVPEVISAVGEAVLSGSLKQFSLREVLDFLNNGGKSGVLEVESIHARIRFHLERGRIQGVFAVGLSPDFVQDMIKRLPESLVNLAPVLKMTLGGNGSHLFANLIQLLDHKVLDPRLLKRLLRYQAAMLTWFAMQEQEAQFRFDLASSSSTLPGELPLDSSLVSLLVDASTAHDEDSTTPNESQLFARRAIRGQNLDRAGLSARHISLMSALNQPRSARQLAESLNWNLVEVQQVLRGFLKAELVEPSSAKKPGDSPLQQSLEQPKLPTRDRVQTSRGNLGIGFEFPASSVGSEVPS